MNGAKEQLKILQEANATAAASQRAWQQNYRLHKSKGLADLQGKLDHLQANELPEKLGKLIAELDLQNTFIGMGLHVRSFSDAEQVYKYLIPLMEERMMTVGTVRTWGLIDEIIWICHAATEILDSLPEFTK